MNVYATVVFSANYEIISQYLYRPKFVAILQNVPFIYLMLVVMFFNIGIFHVMTKMAKITCNRGHKLLRLLRKTAFFVSPQAM